MLYFKANSQRSSLFTKRRKKGNMWLTQNQHAYSVSIRNGSFEHVYSPNATGIANSNKYMKEKYFIITGFSRYLFDGRKSEVDENVVN